MIERKIGEDASGQRLDKYLRKVLKDVPLSHVYKLLRTKKVRVNGARGHAEDLLKGGDVVTIRGDEEQLLAARPESERKPARAKEPLKVLYEDDYLMAIDKPAGMAVHPGSGIESGTVVDEVRAMLGPHAVHNEFAPSPAHRLDRDTSGVLLVAKRRPAMVRLTEIFTAGTARKRYLALAKGRFAEGRGTIDLPLSEHEQTAKSRAAHGVKLQPAVTHWRVLAAGPNVSLLECTIETGRTHQIRRHLVAVGHPVAGDRRHGDFPFNRELKAKFGLKRMFLHARSMEIEHPITGKKLYLQAKLPPELTDALKRMGIAEPA
jgi:23S rRNA pseudouridine955/2504/2580 synthase